MKTTAFCCALLGMLCLPSVGRATDYYAAPNGSQTGAGTVASPWNVSKAQSTAKAGDTVYFRGGTYTSGLSPANSGTSTAWVTFAAYPGELPIFDGSAGSGVGTSKATFIRYVGLASRNHSSSGFSNGWTDSNCATTSNGDQQFINVIADGNGINGIAFYCAQDLLIDQSIVAHNGNMPPSWSSGVNLFHVFGDHTTNIVRNTISFENIDICGQAGCTASTGKASDGSGFIVDQNSTGALLMNNVGFRNGGSCIRLTNSANVWLINNTCYHDGLNPFDAGAAPTKPGEIYYSDPTSKSGAVFMNNLGAASGYNNDQNAWGGQLPTLTTSYAVNANAATPFFLDPAGTNPDFHLTTSAQSIIIDKGTTTNAPTTDIGFDPKCIKQGTTSGGPSWWQYVIDYNYIASIGGVAACFKAGNRSGAPDIGAYEYGATVSGCASAADCNDNDVCTTDSCNTTTGVCGHAAVAGCCKSAADCNDNDVCTTDSCTTSTGVCGHAAVAGCCKSAADCNDNDVCTTDSCNATTGVCGHAAVAGCCKSAADCNDGNTCTTDTCTVSTGVCSHSAVANCCVTATDCDDTNPCTTDSCSANQCAHAAINGCCQQDSACNDGNACTSDSCDLSTHSCTSSPISSCCNTDADCPASTACVQSHCNVSTHACTSTSVQGCCSADSDCNDNDACTTDACNTATGTCSNTAIASCCQLDGDCNDGDPCTTDSCDLGTHTCAHASASGCCVLDSQCADTDPCTLDRCNLSANQCEHPADPACNGTGGSAGAGAGTGGMGGVSSGSGGATPSTGGTTATGGVTSAQAGNGTSTGGSATRTSADAPGCACSLPSSSRSNLPAIGAALAAAWVAVRRRRSGRCAQISTSWNCG